MARSGVGDQQRRLRGCKSWLALGAVCLVVLSLAGCAQKPISGPQASSPGSPVGPLVQLELIPIAPDGSLDGYSRALFQLWSDTNRNGCDSRNDALARDLTGVTTKPGTHNCVVMSGMLLDPYTGTSVEFVKAHADLVPIDHVVPLAVAWRHGAAAWSDTERMTFGNDLDELQATTAAANKAKGGSGPAQWLPPNQAYRCTYAGRYVTILASYALSINQADAGALRAVLEKC